MNIINMGSAKYKYLTAGSTIVGEPVWLAEGDDGSMKHPQYLQPVIAQ